MSDIEDYIIYAWPPRYSLAIADYMVSLNSPCVHCGTDLRRLHPQANLYPHMTGTCKAWPVGQPAPTVRP